ncbi:MAG: hypothetical protein LBE62_05960 [Azonexus sp.]|jgi:tetratricopeptide (TPR) repeat protein|nr:hypothetical protein [Azonexus sp.]
MEIRKLPDHIYDELCAYGEKYRAAKAIGDIEKAEDYLSKLWLAMPEPKYFWDWSQSIIKSIAEFYFEEKNYTEAEKWAKQLFNCQVAPGDAGPYIITGKIYLESGNEALATEYLTKAVKLAGRRGFFGENPKYLKYAQQRTRQLNSATNN